MVTLADDHAAAIHAAVETAFPVTGAEVRDGRLVFEIIPGADDKARFLRLRSDLDPLGVLPLLRRREGKTVIMLAPKPPRTATRWALPAGLFAATFVTMFLAGGLNTATGRGLGHFVAAGLAFSLTLMVILFCHEMGHKLVSIWRGIDAGLPYFIPMVPIPGLGSGTLGAVIFTRTPAPNRDALVELGASGPIAGFVAAVPFLIYGVTHSSLVARSALLGHGCSFSDPLLVDFLVRWLLHPDPSMEVISHPVLFAGWWGLLVTAINLLPGSMLDGGHVTRALFGSRAHLILSVVAAGVAYYFRYWPMAVLILLLLRRGHPGPLDDCSPVTAGRVAMAGALVVIFALSVVPISISCL
jgi:hypothetical protein